MLKADILRLGNVDGGGGRECWEAQLIVSTNPGSSYRKAVRQTQVGSTASARKLSSLGASAGTRINMPFVPLFCSFGL